MDDGEAKHFFFAPRAQTLINPRSWHVWDRSNICDISFSHSLSLTQPEERVAAKRGHKVHVREAIVEGSSHRRLVPAPVPVQSLEAIRRRRGHKRGLEEAAGALVTRQPGAPDEVAAEEAGLGGGVVAGAAREGADLLWGQL